MSETTQVGDFIIDNETGEIVAYAGAKPQFVVDSDDAADWVLGKIGAEIDELSRLKDNYAKLSKAAENRQAWLLHRFAPELERYAKQKLGGGKERSIRTLHGRFGFRNTKGSVKVKPGLVQEAVDWCKCHGLIGAVRSTESVLVSEIPDQAKATLPADLFEQTPAGDKFYVG